MRIIADSGSTKTNWHVLKVDGSTEIFETIGLNPYIIKDGTVWKELKANFPKHLKPLNVREIYFYGAGCSSASQNEKIFSGLERFFPATILHVHHDLLAAARALWGKDYGLVGILGTGSSTALYDGEKVSEQIPSLGYVLGDEGSGAYIGKMLIKAYLENDLPLNVSKLLNKYHGFDVHQILSHVYQDEYPNRFLGQFTRFVKDNIEFPSMTELVKDSFDAFFDKQILKYQNYSNYKLRCMGSVAYYFQDILKESAAEHGIVLEEIIQDPLPRLIDYHNKFMEV